MTPNSQLQQKIFASTASFNRQSESDSNTVFDHLVNSFQSSLSSVNSGSLSISKLTESGTKLKGDLFEEFCKIYLLKVKKFDQVFLLCEVPDDLLSKLGLHRRDFGIDLIAIKKSYNQSELYYPVQCKFKKPHRDGIIPNTKFIRYNCVNFKELATFYLMCSKSGPWQKLIVMTNGKYVRHVGKKTEKDWSICLGSFRKLSCSQLLEMMGVKGRCIGEAENSVTPTPKNDLQKMREARIARFSENLKKS
jgi:hypothetical protein